VLIVSYNISTGGRNKNSTKKVGKNVAGDGSENSSWY